MKKFIPIFISILGLPVFIFAQTKEERAKIASFSNQEANKIQLAQLKSEDAARKIRLQNYFLNNPTVKKVEEKDGVTSEIMDVLPSGEIIYARTDNAGASITARANKLYNGGSLGLNIQGQNMIAGVWDGANARFSHQEFMVGGNSKVFMMDGGTYADHATHVSGTISAQGINTDVKGLAFNSSIYSYNWDTDLTEMLNEASGGMLASNHSYGIGSLSSLWFFGAYDSRAKEFDNITYGNPFYLPVVSAGNSRNLTTAPASTQLGNKGGFDLIYGHANAKNVITVAAVEQVNSYVDSSSVIMSSFSSWGPSDDGRIKPDISMKGVNVKSTISTSDTSLGIMSGTSMAAPGITGVVLLLQQYYNQLYSNYMKSATVKGLILHTADEAGDYQGPDYLFGWGLVNAEKAAITIRDKNLASNRSIMEELTLTNGGTYSKGIVAAGSTPLKVSISWTDPAYGTANTGTTDPATKYLVNDLDLKVTSSTGTIYYPWKLQGMAAPSFAATRTSSNDVDNFERVDVDVPAGTYTISVSHKGSLVNSTQNFSLIVTGANISTLSTNDVKANTSLQIFPNPTSNVLFLKNNNNKVQHCKIIDMSGKIVKNVVVDNDTIDISSLTPNQYILICKDRNDNTMSFKFLKK